MSHAITIRSGGRLIGAIHSWAPVVRRTVDTEFEVNAEGHGMPVDLVPQNVDGREIRISRYDTYRTIMEEVFGSSELIVLADQARPFAVRETWRGPGINVLGGAGTVLGGVSSLAGSLGLSGVARAADSAQADFEDAIAGAATSSSAVTSIVTALATLTADTRVYEYTGCYFTDIGRQIDAKNDRVVSVEATLIWQERRRVV